MFWLKNKKIIFSHTLLSEGQIIGMVFFLFGSVLYVPVDSYGNVGKVSSPNHTFFLGKLD